MNKLFFSLGLSFILGLLLFTSVALAAPELIKSADFDTVYYLDEDGIRHPFPNIATYQSWYGNDFSQVSALSNQTLAQYPLGSNITVRPGTKIVKVPTAPQVYAVEQGGMLREIKNESIAANIYGANWASRVIDLPEVFFGNYEIGEPLDRESDMPDSILLEDEDNGNYYYVNNGVFQEFESTEAVLANRYSLNDAIFGNPNYYFRTRPINGLAKNVFNPAAKALTEKYDCEVENLNAAFIFLAEDSYLKGEIDRVDSIKVNVSNYYDWASRGLSSINVNYSTAILIDDGQLIKLRQDGTYEIRNEVMNTFYDSNEDIFDFIFVFTNFDIPHEDPSRIAYFVQVSNRIKGIGRDTIKASNLYGSTGKLKGVIMMGNISNYSPEEISGMDRVMDIVAHEILHQWAAYVRFDDNGEESFALLRDDKAHWNNYVSFISPIGGSGWIDQGNGNFFNGLVNIDSNKRQYTDLDLYLMGLLPKQFVEPVKVLIPGDPNAEGNTIKGTQQEITIDQIVDIVGERRCVLE